ncbi:MAG: hypothetical protein M0R51_08270 [Clostridia bacterium]|jgi:hypothetical protein|nr:hypothetical protein [Clostridia bacterium]
MVKKYEIKNSVIKAVDTEKQKKRVLVIASCKSCPCRFTRGGLPFCMVTGENIQLSIELDFPESCILDTLREFYESLKKSQNESN